MLGYLLSAAVHGLLLAACLVLWRRRLSGSGLTQAIAVQFGWSLLLATAAAGVAVPPGLVLAAEYLRSLAWLLVLTRYLRGAGDQRIAVTAHRVALALVALVIAATAVGWVLRDAIAVRYLERYGLWGPFVFSIGGLVLVEQVARNTRSAHRWALKYVWLGIGALYAWDLCLFSIVMLRGSAAGDFWIARGFLNGLVGGLLALGLSRVSGWESGSFLSTRLAFFNATLVAASLYVLAMAGGSFVVRRLGGPWGGAGQLLFVAAGVLVLAVAVLSEQFRAWSRVTIAKHFSPYRYDYRSEWQKLTHALSESAETPLYERIARVMAGFVSSASGGLWLKDAEGAYVPVGGDLAPAGASHESGCADFFDYLLYNEWISDLDEVRNPHPDKRTKAVPPPPAWMLTNPRMWLTTPLICGRALVGFVIIGQPLAPVRLSWEELDLLKAAGRQIASFLAFEQAAKRLAEAHQFEAMNRLSAVLMHDLRHLIAQQALVVQNASRHRGNPEFFDDAILTIDNSVKRMTRLMEELRAGVLEGEPHRVELGELCVDAVRRCAVRQPVPVLEVQERALEVLLHRERLLQVLEHIIHNAQDATAGAGEVTVHLHRMGSAAVIEIADTGCGMDAEFIRSRLFRPFDSTKGEAGFGIGAYQAREFVRKCGGSVEVDSAVGRGTRFVIHLPLAPGLVAADNVATYELQAN